MHLLHWWLRLFGHFPCGRPSPHLPMLYFLQISIFFLLCVYTFSFSSKTESSPLYFLFFPRPVRGFFDVAGPSEESLVAVLGLLGPVEPFASSNVPGMITSLDQNSASLVEAKNTALHGAAEEYPYCGAVSSSLFTRSMCSLLILTSAR